MYKGSVLDKEKEIKKEIYLLIREYKKLNPNDEILDIDSGEFTNNDIDAMRHAYTSGVFAMEYNVFVAEVLGEMREMFPGNNPTAVFRKYGPDENMDIWNNNIGREYGNKSKNRQELFDHLIKALKNGELIIDLNDSRKHSPIKKAPITESVIVAQESPSGENLLFLDINKMQFLSKEEFVTKIKNKKYGNEYEIRIVDGKEVPSSKRDGKNNLG